MKVLVAEDDVLCCRALQSNLIDWGYEVVDTKNGDEAWNAFMADSQQRKSLNDESIRIAILDWEMPKIDGIDLCRRIRSQSTLENKSYIYIILLTGRNHQEDIIQGLTAGADDYMTKPFNFMELEVRLMNGVRILQLEESRMRLANTDSLTQLWNRNKILDFLNEEVERAIRHGHPTGVIWADIDQFKQVNDTYGHPVGDQVLTEVSSRLRKSSRKYDKIGRYGGDEFLAVVPNCRREHIQHVGERFRRMIYDNRIATNAGPLPISISVGVTSSEFNSNASPEQLIQASDNALYDAKRKGRNSVGISDP